MNKLFFVRKIKLVMSFFHKINLKSIYFNFHYLPFNQAIKLPILLSNKVYLNCVNGELAIQGKLKTGMIRIGFKNVGIFDQKYSRSIWEVSGKVVFQGNAFIGHGSKISVGPEGEIIFGKNFTISAESSIVSFKRIVLGDNCVLSWDILLMDTDFHKIMTKSGVILNNPKEINIGANVLIGLRSVIFKGTTIPNNTVISALSNVRGKFKIENTIIGGNPAEVQLSNVYCKG